MNVRKAIAVISKKYFLAFQILLGGHQPLADIGGHACVRKRDLPVVNITVKEIYMFPSSRQFEVVGQALVVIQKIVLDRIGTVPKAQYEVLVPEVSVVLHHMPQDWPVPDRHHWFRNVLGVIPKPHPKATTKNHHLHRFGSFTSTKRGSALSFVDLRFRYRHYKFSAPFADVTALLENLV